MPQLGEMPLNALFELFGSSCMSKDKFVQIVDEPKFTTNLFGPLTEIAGKSLKLIERNRWGDCLCVFDGRVGTNLVDVDNRDIVNE